MPGGEEEPMHDALEQHHRRARVGLLQNSTDMHAYGLLLGQILQYPVTTPLARGGRRVYPVDSRQKARASTWMDGDTAAAVVRVFEASSDDK